MKTAISIPDDLFAEAEAFAQQRGLTRSELYQRAVFEFLEARRSDLIREELDRVYGQVSSKIDKPLELAQAETLPPEEW